jgi:hypothetical protein
MPYKSKEARREWETSPEQRVAAAERQASARERREELLSLAAVLQIHDRCGHWRFCKKPLRDKVRARETEIRDILAARAKEPVQVIVDGKRVRDFTQQSRTRTTKGKPS